MASRPARILFLADTHLGIDLPARPRVERRRRGEDFFANFEAAPRAGAARRGRPGGARRRRAVPQPGAAAARLAGLRPAAQGRRGGGAGAGGAGQPRALGHPLLAARRPRPGAAVRPAAHLPAGGRRAAARPGRLPFRARAGAAAVSARWCTPPGSARPPPTCGSCACTRRWRGRRWARSGSPSARETTWCRRASCRRGVAAVLSGHIHRHQVLTCDLGGRPLAAPVLYPGSIERTSFAEKDEEKGYLVLEVDGGRRGRRQARGLDLPEAAGAADVAARAGGRGTGGRRADRAAAGAAGCGRPRRGGAAEDHRATAPRRGPGTGRGVTARLSAADDESHAGERVAATP